MFEHLSSLNNFPHIIIIIKLEVYQIHEYEKEKFEILRNISRI